MNSRSSQIKNSCQREYGVLLHISSLPSRYGIGTFGKEAYKFVDFLCAAGQSIWQILPLNPVGVSGSPYSSDSAFAISPYFIDLDILIEEKLLTRSEVERAHKLRGKKKEDNGVDYEWLESVRIPLLRRAFERGVHYRCYDRKLFLDEHSWVAGYAMYRASRTCLSDVESARSFDENGLHRHVLDGHSDEIEFHIFLQFLCYTQWSKLREYANGRGIRIMGDMPMYVNLDSADVWAHNKIFMLDSELKPTYVAGVPPDYFSETGQLWGNPLYDWEELRKTGFEWWKSRMLHMASIFDMLRIDHFRAIESFYAVEGGEQTAEHGCWMKGPGMELIAVLNDMVEKNGRRLRLIAEDLGIITPEVDRLRKLAGYPGIRVVQFAFDGSADNPHLPHLHDEDSVCYTGTHDNATLSEWLNGLKSEEKARVFEYFGTVEYNSIIRGIIEKSPAKLFIAQMQDYLQLGGEARMNIPGQAEGNWRFRLKKRASRKLARKLRCLCNCDGVRNHI